MVLGYAAIPAFDPEKDLDMAKLWSGCAEFGDAIAVMLLSDSSSHLVVPHKHLLFSDGNSATSLSASALCFCFLEAVMGQQQTRICTVAAAAAAQMGARMKWLESEN